MGSEIKSVQRDRQVLSVQSSDAGTKKRTLGIVLAANTLVLRILFSVT